jgi:hypothetical protein
MWKIGLMPASWMLAQNGSKYGSPGDRPFHGPAGMLTSRLPAAASRSTSATAQSRSTRLTIGIPKTRLSAPKPHSSSTHRLKDRKLAQSSSGRLRNSKSQIGVADDKAMTASTSCSSIIRSRPARDVISGWSFRGLMADRKQSVKSTLPAK